MEKKGKKYQKTLPTRKREMTKASGQEVRTPKVVFFFVFLTVANNMGGILLLYIPTLSGHQADADCINNNN